MDFDSSTLVVLVGASGGIGSAIRETLTRRNVTVVCVDVVPGQESSEIGSTFLRLDFAMEDAPSRVLESIGGYPATGFHVMNVAGGAVPAEIPLLNSMKNPSTLLLDTMHSNLLTSINAVRLCEEFTSILPSWSDASVTLCSSINAAGGFGYPMYSSIKGAIEALTRSQCRHLGRLGIRINTIQLGTVRTPVSEALHGPAENEHFTRLLHGTALGRFTSPVEAATAFCSLALDWTAVTGTITTVDTGQSVPTTANS